MNTSKPLFCEEFKNTRRDPADRQCGHRHFLRRKIWNFRNFAIWLNVQRNHCSAPFKTTKYHLMKIAFELFKLASDMLAVSPRHSLHLIDAAVNKVKNLPGIVSTVRILHIACIFYFSIRPPTSNIPPFVRHVEPFPSIFCLSRWNRIVWDISALFSFRYNRNTLKSISEAWWD